MKFFTSIFQQSPKRLKVGGLLTIAVLLVSNCSVFLEKQSKLPLATPISEWKLYDIENITWAMDSSSFAVLGKEKDDDIFGVYMYRTSAAGKDWFHKADISLDLAFSPDNQVIAIPIFPSRNLILLNQNTGDLIKEVSYYMQPSCFGLEQIRYSPDGKKIFSLDEFGYIGHEYSEIYVWNVEIEQCQGTLIREQGSAFDFELSQDGDVLVLGLSSIGRNAEQQVHVWDIGKQKLTCSFPGGRPVSFTFKGDIIAAKNVNKQEDVDLWNAKSCKFIATIHSPTITKVYSVDISPDGKLLAIGDSGAFQVWDIASRKFIFESEKLPSAVKRVAFSPDGKFLLTETDRVSANDKATITLWSIGQ